MRACAVASDTIDQLTDPGWDGPAAAAAVTSSALAVAQLWASYRNGRVFRQTSPDDEPALFEPTI